MSERSLKPGDLVHLVGEQGENALGVVAWPLNGAFVDWETLPVGEIGIYLRKRDVVGANAVLLVRGKVFVTAQRWIERVD